MYLDEVMETIKYVKVSKCTGQDNNNNNIGHIVNFMKPRAKNA